MRWQALFDDLEGQLDAAEAAELSAEVAERSRLEAARVRLPDRLRAAVGTHLHLHLLGAGPLAGRLADCGGEWLLLEEDGGREALAPLVAVLGVSGLGGRTAPADSSAVAKRLDLRWALRAIARSRATVIVRLVDGSALTGTLDRVGADHVDLAEHGPDEPRRAGAVRQVRTVPLTAVVLVRSG